MQIQEVKTIEHKGVKVAIKLDYHFGTASLVEVHRGYPTKSYCFGERGLEYMKGWADILEAMQLAVKECRRLLEKDLAEKSRLKEEAIVAALTAVNNKGIQ